MKTRKKNRLLLREATIVLMLVRVAVRIVSSEALFRWIGRPARKVTRFAVAEIDWVSWAIRTLEARSESRYTEPVRAIAAHAMLRRRGIVSRLCLGVIRNDDVLESVAWVEAGHKLILEPANFSQVIRVAEFGGQR